jgi:hypothetical protein
MGRSSLLLLLAMRSPVHGILGAVGSLAMLGGLVCLVLAISGKGILMVAAGVIGLGIWYGSTVLRWSYDSAVLRRAPDGEYLHLL